MEIVKPKLTEIGEEIVDRLLNTRKRELELIADLSEEQLIGPTMRITEPPIWELGHVGWFQDRWILQHLDKREPADEQADSLYDSFNIPNVERWELMFPSRGQTIEYITDILERIIHRLENHNPSEKEIYFYRLVLNHEDMHTETLHHIRHTLSYSAPKLSDTLDVQSALDIDHQFDPHDVDIPGGTYLLGGTQDMPFIFDNEKWAHAVEVKPFSISATPVTFAEYQQFVDEGGYLERSIWRDEGLEWVMSSGQKHPVYWKKDSQDQWMWRWFDQWRGIDPFLPMVNVNWYEANAFCEWAGRRLPSEAEWELAASSYPTSDGKKFSDDKRLYPWGNQPPGDDHANLNSWMDGLVDVRAFPEGDSGFGLRQMIGNVWEWTADTFDAYPGYIIDPYDTYSAPSFGQQKVLRGGCWATRPGVIRNTFRNFYTPDRNNFFAGFRTVRK
jgi:iron(II)-dependent oxidoreductase